MTEPTAADIEVMGKAHQEGTLQIHEFKIRRAIDSLIPREMQPTVKKWAKANNCSLEAAIVRLIEWSLASD